MGSMNPSTETSGKPADIPQDVWDSARHALSDGFTVRIESWDHAVRVSRAILDEAERIAVMADEYGKVAAEPALITFAEIIRKRGEG